MNKWREVRLNSLAHIYSGFAFSGKDMKNEGVPIIKIGNIKDKVVANQCDVYFPRDKILEKHKRYFLDNDDILIAMTGAGSVGKLGKMFKRDGEYLVNQRVGIIRANENVNAIFLYYILTMPNYESYLYNVGIGAGQPNISAKDIGGVYIPVPDLETQEKIADVLSTYDRLIENNNRRIEMLEKISEELYKEWFVRMRFPGYQNNKFIKGIPEGWEVRKLNEIFDIADGTHDTPKKVSEGVPLVTGKNIVNGTIDFDSTYNISIEDFEKINVRSAIYKNDILYSNIGTIGTMTIINNDNKYSVKNLIILKTNEYEFYEYIYLLFKSKSSQDFFESVASGASQKFISLTEMRKYKVLLPCSKLLVEFKANVKDLFEEIKILKEQNKNLIKQRDLLLPRLMNGTIGVK